jgi:hypothetical protein
LAISLIFSGLPALRIPISQDQHTKRRTLERAKAKLNVTSRLIRVGEEGRWAWSMTGRFGRILKLSELPKIDEEEEW